MIEKTREQLRVLLPSKPKDDFADVTRMLRALLPGGGACVRRLYVHRPIGSDYFIPDTYARFAEIAQIELDAESATRFETEQEMGLLAGAGFQVDSEIVRGTPAEEILREASVWRADLVAVRTRSLAARDHRIGGMASALLYHATCPVLTHYAVPAGYKIRRILIPTDFSRGSHKSANWGLAVAAITEATPILFHAIAPWNGRHGIDQDELLGLATQELERWRARTGQVATSPLKEARVVTAPTPAEGILSFAKTMNCDLVVLSATGASAMRAILVGANTRKVVRGSACPVLVVPASNRVSAEGFLERARSAAAAELVAMPQSAELTGEFL